MRGRIVGVQGGIPQYLRMLGMDGWSRRLILLGVQGMDKILRMGFGGIGGVDLVCLVMERADVDFDLEAGYEYLLDTYGFIDTERTVALGASYGGYMVIIR